MIESHGDFHINKQAQKNTRYGYEAGTCKKLAVVNFFKLDILNFSAHQVFFIFFSQNQPDRNEKAERGPKAEFLSLRQSG